MGILFRGSGLALITAAILSTISWMFILLALLGLTFMIFGRTLWELTLVQLGIELHSSTIERSETPETPTNNAVNRSGEVGRS